MNKVIIGIILAILATGCAGKRVPTLQEQIETEIRFVEETERVVTLYWIVGDVHKEHLARLEKYLREVKGTSVTYDPTLLIMTGNLGTTGCYYFADGERCFITIDSSKGSSSQFITLMHEAVHSFHGSIMAPAQAEVLAEVTAYLAGKDLGMSTQAASMSYIRQVPYEIREQVLIAFEGQILAWKAELVKISSGVSDAGK